MLKLSALLRLTDSDVERRGRQQCSVKILESTIKIDKKGKHKCVLAAVVATTVPRTVCIKFYDLGEKNLINSSAWVTCSCQNFKYALEVADTVVDSSSIILSNGRRPVETNPRMIPALCKHLVALAAVAVVIEAKDPAAEAAKKKEDAALKKQEMLKKQQEQKEKRDAIRQKAEQDRLQRQEQQKLLNQQRLETRQQQQQQRVTQQQPGQQPQQSKPEPIK